MIEQRMDLSIKSPDNPAIISISPSSILLDAPANSGKRVSFETSPKVSEISFNNGKPRSAEPLIYQIKEKTVILNKSLLAEVKLKAKKQLAMLVNKSNIVLKYRRKDDLDADLRALGLKQKTYIENKIIVSNIGYKETEDSVREYFSRFADVEKVVLEKNSKGFCTGKGTITFQSALTYTGEFKLGNRILRVERIKKQIVNTTRLFISHMHKDMNISKFRSVLKSFKFTPKNVRIDLNSDPRRTCKGFGFAEFNTHEEAERFLREFGQMKDLLGTKSFVEYSQEKNNNK